MRFGRSLISVFPELWRKIIVSFAVGYFPKAGTSDLEVAGPSAFILLPGENYDSCDTSIRLLSAVNDRNLSSNCFKQKREFIGTCKHNRVWPAELVSPRLGLPLSFGSTSL